MFAESVFFMIFVIWDSVFCIFIENKYTILYYCRKKVSMTTEQQHQEDLQRIRGFRLLDDDFMNACFDDNIEGTELILRIILNKPDLKVENVKTQRIMKNLLGRDIWLDIDAKDSNGSVFNIEVQRANKGADRKRARYHSSILDAHLLKPSDDFSLLPETYVIFITEHDVIGANEPLYFIDRQITTTGESFNDGEHIIYVNAANDDVSTELGKLMHDFRCISPDEMYFKQLADKARYFKEDKKGVANMSKVLEDMRNETAERTKIEAAIKFIKLGKVSLEEIANSLDLPIEKVKELAAANNSGE